MDERTDWKDLAAAARGGRVAHGGFLDEATSARWAAALREAGVRATVDGGVPAAERRVVTAHPDSVPYADTPLLGAHLPEAYDAGAARAALEGAGVPAAALGDALEHVDGLSFVVLEEARERVPERVDDAGAGAGPVQVVPLERLARGSRKRLRAVVPSLRADALGAKAFGVSRAYFGKGIRSGNVRLDGRPAGKSAEVPVGAELWAAHLGRVRLLEVEGSTKRGNAKVLLEVERP